MKFTNILTLFAATTAMASTCHPYYECCDNCNTILTDDTGKWGVKNGEWCFVDNEKCDPIIKACKYEAMGYKCCSHCNVMLTEGNNKWGAENGEWCGIPDSCEDAKESEEPKESNVPTNSTSSLNVNFFDNKLYTNQDRKDRIQSSIDKLDGDLKKKAMAVQDAATGIWLSWDKAPESVTWHLSEAGDKTAVFILYWIPTRDCNSFASQGGAQNMEEYHEYVQRILKGFKEHPESKIVLVIEPDTLGNLITSQENENCKKVHSLHKEAIAYAVNTLASLDNVQAYIDAAHGRWLGPHTDKVAAVIKEIVDMAPEGKIRGLSTNVSNYQPTEDEYKYHEKLHAALEKVGLHDMRFIVDTARNGVDLAESLVKTGTWCNVKGTGFGERPKGNPDPVNKPLLDAYFWLKPGGDSDGSSKGDHADPVCAHDDSLPGGGDPGDWFHEYFVQLLENANPPIEI